MVSELPHDYLDVMENAGVDHRVRHIQHTDEPIYLRRGEFHRVLLFVVPQPAEDRLQLVVGGLQGGVGQPLALLGVLSVGGEPRQHFLF